MPETLDSGLRITWLQLDPPRPRSRKWKAWMAHAGVSDRGDVFLPGAVFTIEPGLYYHSKGYGVRIEDTYYCTPAGQFESLTPFPKELVIPIESM